MGSLTEYDVRKNNFLRYIQCFQIDVEDNKLLCQITSCGKSYKDKSGAIRHLKIKHQEFYQAIRANNEKPPDEPIKIEIRCKVEPDAIWSACAELICVNALPVSVVEFPAFKKILEPYVVALRGQGVNLVINCENIKKYIHEKSNKIKQKIRDQVRGKLISLMADIGSKYNRSILGISIAYMYKGKICVHTIGMHVLKFSHTADYIYKIIIQILSEYDIELRQIISVTTDNGRNMIKTVSMIDAAYQNSHSLGLDENIVQEQSDEYIDEDIFDEAYYDDLLGGVRNRFPDILHTDIIHGVSCAAHCIHLVVTHAINKCPSIHTLIEKSRNLSKKLRTPTFRALMKDSGLPMAILDVVTRWNSIYTMVRKYTLRLY